MDLEYTRADHNTERSVFQEIAAIHQTEIRHGALPLFGARFLASLYRGLATTAKTGVWIASRDGRVLGFLAGTVNPAACFRSLLLRHGATFCVQALRSGNLGVILSRLFSIARYPFRTAKLQRSTHQAAVHLPELLAMGVAPTARRQGVGRQLVGLFQTFLQDQGLSPAFSVTTNRAEVESNHFYQALGGVPIGVIAHHQLELQMYEVPPVAHVPPKGEP